MTDIKDKIELISLNDLQPYGNNPKEHPSSQIDKIASSIKHYGFDQPIVVTDDMEIIKGHGRLEAAKKLGMERVPVIRRSNLTEAQVKGARLADNRSAESGWDEELLGIEFEELEDMNFNLELTAFDVEEIDSFMDNGKEVEEDGFVPGEDDKYDVKRGQIWKLGDHRLMCGDATCEEDVEKLMDGDKANMVFTDPPYGMNLNTDFSNMVNKLEFAQEKNIKSGKKYNKVIGDSEDYDPTHIFEMFDSVEEIFLWGADYYRKRILDGGSWFVWDKRITESADKMYGSVFELCWSKNKHRREIVREKWAGVFGTEQEFDHKRYHPTQKPIKLSTWFIEKFSNEDDLIVDLFGGSGSTLIATQQLNRKCYMLEIDPHYCSVILERYEDYTGDKPELIEQ